MYCEQHDLSAWPPNQVMRPGDQAVRARSTMVCLDCGTVSTCRRVAPHSFLSEIGVWLVCGLFATVTRIWLALLLALGYSLWRTVARKRACTACGSARLVPEDSPAGRRMVEALRKPPDA